MPTEYNNVTAADLARFIAEKTHHNLFLTGKAGTGKTVFLKDFVKNTAKRVVVLAPTGIAAINAGAMTIHSFFCFDVAPNPGGKVNITHDFVLDDENEELVRNIDLIIIDEVSMVRADVMDHISEKLRLIRDSKEPFGGVQLLLIGDLLQLAPVVTKDDEAILKDCYDSNYYFFNSRALRNVGFETVCLDKVYRQDNPEFISILNKAREGRVSWGDCAKLNSRYLPDFEVTDGTYYISLVAQKRQADIINSLKLDSVEGEGRTYYADVTGEFPKESYPTMKELHLKKGVQVMFVKNSKDNEYCNGTLGEVVDMGDEDVSVKVGEKIINVRAVSWDNIRYELNGKKKQIQKVTTGKFTQFPLKPAWAITIHKSQGLSFNHAIIDIPRAFAAGQSYVALSRCRTLEGLVLKRKVYPDSFFVDPLIAEFYKGIDDAAHIARLAKAVDYVPFEWEKGCASQNDNDCSTESTHLYEMNDIIDAVYCQLGLYHETGSELDEAFYAIVSEAKRIVAGNVYYQMKLDKVINSWGWWFKN